MDYKSIIEKVYNKINQEKNKGEIASYIPELKNVDPNSFGIQLTTIENETIGVGDYLQKFSIQSIAKVFSLSFIYQKRGEKIWKRVGVEPSGTSFNSLLQLEADRGKPRNPFNNSGALVICDIIISHFDDAKGSLLEYIREISDIKDLNYSSTIADSERKYGHRNMALCNYLKSFGSIKNEVEQVLDLYFNLCSIEMNCAQLSNTLLFLANKGCKVSDGKKVLSRSKTKRINAVMQSCGFYDESGEFTFKVGLPGKSGVGGGIIAIHPSKYTISVYSPKLRKKGNSYRGMKFLEAFTTETKYSIF